MKEKPWVLGEKQKLLVFVHIMSTVYYDWMCLLLCHIYAHVTGHVVLDFSAV